MVLSLHHVPGRIRVSLAALKRNRSAAAPLSSKLLELGGVRSASVNVWSGSVTVHYDRNRFETESFWSTLRELGHIDQTVRRAPSPAANDMTGAATAAMKAIEETLVTAALEHFFGRSAGALIRLFI